MKSHLAVLILLLATGCVSSRTITTGTPFLAAQAPQAGMDALARQVVARAKTIPEAQALIAASAKNGPKASPPKVVVWRGVYLLHPTPSIQESHTWRFGVVRAKRTNLAVYDSADVTTFGYLLTVNVVDGAVVGAQAEVTTLTEREREWLTHHAVSVGTAALGTLFMLAAF